MSANNIIAANGPSTSLQKENDENSEDENKYSFNKLNLSWASKIMRQ